MLGVEPNSANGRLLEESTSSPNQVAWDRLVAASVPLTQPARDDDFRDPLRSVDASGWLGESIRGWQVLCLAAGGGRQGPLYAAAGAEVTVVDLSPAMLDRDREIAAARGLQLRTIQCSMERLPMFADQMFDLVIHPVSTCYVPDVKLVFEEVARVLRPQGLYISQHKTPQNLQGSIQSDREGRYTLLHPYYRPRQEAVPPPSQQRTSAVARRLREAGTTEYLHRWEELIGGICRSGFAIEDLVEPFHADGDAGIDEFAHRACYIAPYVRIKARRMGPIKGIFVPFR